MNKIRMSANTWQEHGENMMLMKSVRCAKAGRYVCAVWLAACLFALPLQAAQTAPEPGASRESQAGFWDGFKLGGYGSAGIIVPRHEKTEVGINELSLIVTWEGDSRFKFFSELELEHPVTWREGEDFSEQRSYLDVERLYVDYNLNEKLNLRTGRYLTPAGRWNLIHASPLVWTSSRPLATSRLFPMALNGIMLYGAVPYRQQAFEYMLFGEVLKDQDLERNEIEFRDTFGARFTLSGKTDLGLSLLEFAEREDGRRRYQMLGLDFQHKQHGWEWSGEAFQRFRSDGRNGGHGAYLQGVAPLGQQWFAVARLESFRRPVEASVERWLIGAAWRPQPDRIFKLEYMGGDEQREDSPKGFQASFAILF